MSRSRFTLADKNGPGGAVFQRNPTLDQPLVSDASAPGQCNPQLSVDPVRKPEYNRAQAKAAMNSANQSK